MTASGGTLAPATVKQRGELFNLGLFRQRQFGVNRDFAQGRSFLHAHLSAFLSGNFTKTLKATGIPLLGAAKCGKSLKE